MFSGEQNGYLEPCGCAGLENQKGGLKRRFTFLKQLRDKGWNVVADGPRRPGNPHRRASRDEKSTSRFRALMKMGYMAVGYRAWRIENRFAAKSSSIWTRPPIRSFPPTWGSVISIAA